jgi:predicted Zn-ribbon and HTH transcriptional regulator
MKRRKILGGWLTIDSRESWRGLGLILMGPAIGLAAVLLTFGALRLYERVTGSRLVSAEAEDWIIPLVFIAFAYIGLLIAKWKNNEYRERLTKEREELLRNTHEHSLVSPRQESLSTDSLRDDLTTSPHDLPTGRDNPKVSQCYCANCGYIVNHLPATRCPECGSDFDLEDSRTVTSRIVRSPFSVIEIARISLWMALFHFLIVIVLFAVSGRFYDQGSSELDLILRILIFPMFQVLRTVLDPTPLTPLWTSIITPVSNSLLWGLLFALIIQYYRARRLHRT